jgi:hypothetical protein
MSARFPNGQQEFSTQKQSQDMPKNEGVLVRMEDKLIFYFNMKFKAIYYVLCHPPPPRASTVRYLVKKTYVVLLLLTASKPKIVPARLYFPSLIMREVGD